MTRLAVSITLSVLVLPFFTPRAARAQGDETLPSPVLKPAKLKMLNGLLKQWYKKDVEATARINEATVLAKQPRKRALVRRLRKQASSLRRKARKSKAKFRAAFDKEGKSAGTLLKHVPDMLAIFEGCFPYKRQSLAGQVKLVHVDKASKLSYAVRFPKTYKPNRAWPLLFVLPQRDGKAWAKPKAYLEQVYPKTATKAFGEYIVLVPRCEYKTAAGHLDDLALDGSVDPTNEKQESAEQVRREWFLRILANAFGLFHVHTDRVYLEACGQSVPFALRMASVFPDRFGGLVLKEPLGTEFDNATVFDNMSHIPVLMVASKAAAANAKEIKAMLEAAGHSKVALNEASGSAPFGGSADDVAKWLDASRRNLFAKKIILAPANDRFRKAYWVEITNAEYLTQVAMEERPRVEVTADRATNRIEVKGRNVAEVRLFLNDLLVDLDKKITLVLNGQVREVQRRRSLALIDDVRDGLVVRRNDPRYLFTTTAVYTLPEPKGNAKGASGEAANGK